MIFDDKTTDFKIELKKANKELSGLIQKYQELEADRDYIKSLLDVSHEHNCKLKKENVQLKTDLNDWIEKKMIYYESMIEKTDGYNNVSVKGHLDMLIKLKEWLNR